MLIKTAVSVTALLATGCATASLHHGGVIAFEVASAGDDGLTQKIVASLRTRLGSMKEFVVAPRSPSTLTIIILNALSRQVGDASQVIVNITFSRALNSGELARVKTYRAKCLEADLSKCVSQIARAALRVRTH